MRTHAPPPFLASSIARDQPERGRLGALALRPARPERLFELQPRAAQKLLELLPTLEIGTSRLVDRQVLAGFLDRVRDADNTIALFEQLKAEMGRRSRKKPRALVRRDHAPVAVDSLPSSMALSRGRVEISFLTIEQLAEDLFKLAQLLTENTEGFAQAFEPEPPTGELWTPGEMRDLSLSWNVSKGNTAAPSLPRGTVNLYVKRLPFPAASIAAGSILVQGRLQVDFRSVEQLAESLLMLALVLESEGEQFAVEFEVRDETAITGEAWV